MIADAYTAYGSNLEAGLDGDLEAQDDAAATFNDYYRSAQAEMYEEEYDPLRDEDSDDDRGRGQDQRSSWQETPSSTIYVRVCTSPYIVPELRVICFSLELTLEAQTMFTCACRECRKMLQRQTFTPFWQVTPSTCL